MIADIEFKVIDPVKDSALYAQENDLRYEILRKPLGGKFLDRKFVTFEFESISIHLLAMTHDLRVIGCVLFNPAPQGSGRLYQMAVDANMQSQGIGSRLVNQLETILREKGYKEITLHARQIAVGFYEKLGYHTYGDPFMEVNVPHRYMRKTLA